jgi:hypothetical protein
MSKTQATSTISSIGSNMTQFKIEDRLVLVSYKTIVAVYAPTDSTIHYHRSGLAESTTTMRHIKKWAKSFPEDVKLDKTDPSEVLSLAGVKYIFDTPDRKASDQND